jgi:hypothetical protein
MLHIAREEHTASVCRVPCHNADCRIPRRYRPVCTMKVVEFRPDTDSLSTGGGGGWGTNRISVSKLSGLLLDIWLRSDKTINVICKEVRVLRYGSHKLSCPSQALSSWVQISPETWVSVCVYFLLSVGSGFAAGWSPAQGKQWANIHRLLWGCMWLLWARQWHFEFCWAAWNYFAY